MQPLAASEQALQTKTKALSPLHLTEQHLQTQWEPAQHPCSPSIPTTAISDMWDAGTTSPAHAHPSPPHPGTSFKKKMVWQLRQKGLNPAPQPFPRDKTLSSQGRAKTNGSGLLKEPHFT